MRQLFSGIKNKWHNPQEKLSPNVYPAFCFNFWLWHRKLGSRQHAVAPLTWRGWGKSSGLLKWMKADYKDTGGKELCWIVIEGARSLYRGSLNRWLRSGLHMSGARSHKAYYFRYQRLNIAWRCGSSDPSWRECSCEHPRHLSETPERSDIRRKDRALQ